MISIVIPLHNKEKQIKQTLQSVFNQIFQDFEVIVVDDGSTDNSVAVLDEISDKRIRLIHQENQGVSAARNKGIKEAKYDYVALLDADDEWKPEYLSNQIDLINNFPESSVYACAYELKDSNGNIKPIILNKMPFKEENGVLTNYFEVAACSHPPLWTSAIVAKKEAFLSIGGFPIGIKAGEDLLTWARLAVNYKIAYYVKPLAIFCTGVSSYQENAPKRIPDEENRVGIELERLYKKNKNISGLRNYISLWYKMRASIYLRLNQKYNCLKEIIRALKFNPTSKVLFFIPLLLFPFRFRIKLMSKLSK